MYRAKEEDIKYRSKWDDLKDLVAKAAKHFGFFWLGSVVSAVVVCIAWGLLVLVIFGIQAIPFPEGTGVMIGKGLSYAIFALIAIVMIPMMYWVGEWIWESMEKKA